MTPRLIYCAAGNRRYADIAQRYGFTYGAQLPGTVYFPPYFADQSYDKPRKQAEKAIAGITGKAESSRVYAQVYRQAVQSLRTAYMKALDKHRPYMATVLDLEREDQFDEVMSWAEEASQYVSEVMLIPKYDGAIARLPRTINGKIVRLGYSEPTAYGGTHVPVEEFAGWSVHILGGSPLAQYERAKHLNPVSVDWNYAMKTAHNNQFFSPVLVRAKNKIWPRLRESVFGHVSQDSNYLAFTLSCMNIQALWQGCRALMRFAVEADIPQITKLAHQWRSELGYVNAAALRESIARRSLVVAIHTAPRQREYMDALVSPNSERVVGFVNYRACRDGWQTLYEIGVHRDHMAESVGKALLTCVPGPVRLKCTVDNTRANAFYEAQGFKHVRQEEGRKRRLNVWHKALLRPTVSGVQS